VALNSKNTRALTFENLSQANPKGQGDGNEIKFSHAKQGDVKVIQAGGTQKS
jgi:hypothetical protein